MSDLPPPRLDLLVHSPSPDALVPVLAQLLEPSPPIASRLAPELHESFTTEGRPKTYAELIDRSAKLVEKWDVETQAQFLGSHPRIGETIGLSTMSGQEQAPNDGRGTPGEVLKRLTLLNAVYEEAYPGLRYLTFVNGRPRAAIVPEIEAALDIKLPPPSPSTPEPRLHTLREGLRINVQGSSSWKKELQRGLEAMWAIAHHRREKMNVA